MAKRTDGPPGVGTVYASTVKDAGMKTKREFRLTEFQPPTRIRWAEISKNLVTAPEGGYDLAPEGAGTRLTVYNVLEGFEGTLDEDHHRGTLGGRRRERLPWDQL